ncbi:MAG: HEAT repeat domain-containing protein [Planctomycetota bacterium]|nr:HEAT repeat domain-containing protein [Planctomycetota bacterium]
MSIVGRKVAVMLTLLAIISFVCGSITGYAENEEKIKNLFREGINAFEEGRYEQARIHFAAVMNLNPSMELAAELRDAATQRYLMTLARHADIGPDVWRLINMASRYDLMKKREPEFIKKQVANLNKDFEARKYAMAELVRIGTYAIPHLVPHLADPNAEDGMRSYAFITIQKMGSAAVQPLIELLNTDDNLLKSNVCELLRLFGDERATPYLLQVAKDEKLNDQIVLTAAKAFEQITGTSVDNAAPLQNYFYQAGLKYYLDGPIIQEEAFQADGTVWKWDAEAGNIVKEDIPVFAYNEEIGRRRCFDGINAAPDSPIFTPLIVCIGVSQGNDTRVRHKKLNAILASLPERDSKRNEIMASIAALGSELEKAQRFEVASYLVGQRNLFYALDIALKNERFLDARSIVKYLAEVSDGSLLPAPGQSDAIGMPLIEALDSENATVRYNAAITLGKINPSRPFKGQEKVALTLAAAMGETSDVNVLVVDNDMAVNNKVVAAARNAEFGAIGVLSGRACLRHAGIFPIKDIILLDYTLDDEGDLLVDQVYRRLADQPHTASIPVVFMVPDTAVGEFQAKFPDAKYFVTKPINEVALVQQLKKVVAEEKLENAVRKEINQIAIDSASTLASIPVNDTNIDINAALGPIIAAFGASIDEVRIGAMKTAANIKAAEAIDPLMAVFKDKGNSSEVRITSLGAIGAIDPAKARDLLVEAVGDDDLEIARAAAKALGSKDFAADLINELIKKSLK